MPVDEDGRLQPYQPPVVCPRGAYWVLDEDARRWSCEPLERAEAHVYEPPAKCVEPD